MIHMRSEPIIGTSSSAFMFNRFREGVSAFAALAATTRGRTQLATAGEPETVLLRTHTSPVQIRVMSEQPPPIYAVMPGRVFRRDTADASHMPVFHQIEGLYVDRNVTVSDLKGTVEAVFKEVLGNDVKLRFRPHYFSYTEPSLEIDFTNALVRKLGKEWLEIAGCGMVHPQVFENVGYDPEVWSGWAFGFGIERIAMLCYGITDIRLLYENDIRFLQSENKAIAAENAAKIGTLKTQNDFLESLQFIQIAQGKAVGYLKRPIGFNSSQDIESIYILDSDKIKWPESYKSIKVSSQSNSVVGEQKIIYEIQKKTEYDYYLKNKSLISRFLN